MSHTEKLQEAINKGDIKGGIKLWKDICLSRKIGDSEFLFLLEMIKDSKFADAVGPHIELAIPLWENVADPEDSYKILQILIDLQTSNTDAIGDIAYSVLEKKYGGSPCFEERIHYTGLAPRKNFQGAISKYELLKHLERGNLVLNTKEGGYGEVRNVCHESKQATIEFEGGKGVKNLSFDQAVKNLVPIEHKTSISTFLKEDTPEKMETKILFKQLKSLVKKIKKPKPPMLKEETPLTGAVIRNDIEAVRELRKDRKLVFEKNFLGFNGIEIARYLDRKECLELLEPQPEKTFKVRPKGSSELQTFSQKELEDFFGIQYIRNLKFGNYQLFQEVLKSRSPFYAKKNQSDEEIPYEKLLEYTEENSGKPEMHFAMMKYHADNIHSGYFAPVTIEWIDDTLGYGAFAAKDFKRGDYIGEYVGEVRPFPVWCKQNDYSIVYPNYSLVYYRVDAEVMCNELHFLNHSYHPNTACLSAIDNNLIHPTYMAIKDIPKGTQMTWNYHEDFWKKRGKPVDI